MGNPLASAFETWPSAHTLWTWGWPIRSERASAHTLWARVGRDLLARSERANVHYRQDAPSVNIWLNHVLRQGSWEQDHIVVARIYSWNFPLDQISAPQPWYQRRHSEWHLSRNFARGSRYKSAMFDDMKILQNHIFNQNTHIFIKLDFFMTPWPILNLPKILSKQHGLTARNASTGADPFAIMLLQRLTPLPCAMKTRCILWSASVL